MTEQGKRKSAQWADLSSVYVVVEGLITPTWESLGSFDPWALANGLVVEWGKMALCNQRLESTPLETTQKVSVRI